MSDVQLELGFEAAQPRRSHGCGWLLLDLLAHRGWEIVIGPAVGGGSLVLAEYRTRAGVLRVQRQGASAADVAVAVVKECARLVPAGSGASIS